MVVTMKNGVDAPSVGPKGRWGESMMLTIGLSGTPGLWILGSP
jgi:hypothetical protein